jgi:opacity protein-like surface antigen
LYSLPDRVSDSFWLRPYVGSGANLGHHTLSGTLTGDSVSDDKFGLQAFGGAEMTLAGVPRFALSAEVSYRWSRAPFAGVELGGLGVGLSGHWYVR